MNAPKKHEKLRSDLLKQAEEAKAQGNQLLVIRIYNKIIALGSKLLS